MNDIAGLVSVERLDGDAARAMVTTSRSVHQPLVPSIVNQGKSRVTTSPLTADEEEEPIVATKPLDIEQPTEHVASTKPNKRQRQLLKRLQRDQAAQASEPVATTATPTPTATEKRKRDAKTNALSSDKKRAKATDDTIAAQPAENWQAPPSEWDVYGLHPQLLRGILAQGFTRPTPIQRLCLDAAIRDWRDVVGAAETGSGKTLAFGIPIIQQLLHRADRRRDKEEERRLRRGESEPAMPSAPEPQRLSALVLVPTRELALQVAAHIKTVSIFTSIKTEAIVGGMAPQKQRRLLARRPEVVVATPGRLWELIQQGEPHLCDLTQLHCLVLDEADRMVSHGHFPQLDSILAFVEKQSGGEAIETAARARAWRDTLCGPVVRLSLQA